MPSLNIRIDVSTDNDPEPEAKIVNFDLPVPDDIAGALKGMIDAADATDPEPGDGELDIKKRARIPIRFNLFGFGVKSDVKIDGHATIALVP